MGPPVLWIVGPPGVGKSTVGWALVERLAVDRTVAYLDIDQLGMLYPAPADDPDRWEAKAAVLAAVRPAYAAAGAALLVVSGVTDAEHGPGVAGCRRVGLFLAEDRLAARVLARGDTAADVERVLTEQRALRGSPFLETECDTTGCTVAELVDRLLPWVPTEAVPVPGPAAGRPLPVLLVTGARAVGSSLVGWYVRQRLVDRGERTGFADLAQLSVQRPAPAPAVTDALAVDSVKRLAATFGARGARSVVLAGRLEPERAEALRRAVAPGSLRVVRLRARPATVAARIRSRREGGIARLLPDDLLATTTAERRRVAELSAAQQAADDAAGLGDLVIDTDDLDPQQVADRIGRDLPAEDAVPTAFGGG